MCIVSDSSFPTCQKPASLLVRINLAQRSSTRWRTLVPSRCLVKTTTQQQGSGFLFRMQVKTHIFRFGALVESISCTSKNYDSMIRCFYLMGIAQQTANHSFEIIPTYFNFLILKLAHDRLNLLVLAGWQSGLGQRLRNVACCFRGA